jgi:enterochelin esterase family protein
LRSLDWRSERLDNTRKLSLYLPAAVPLTAAGWPLLLLFDRDAWLHKVSTPALLDRCIAEGRLPALAAVLVGHPTPEHRGRELPCNPDFADAMALELLPWVRSQTVVAVDARRVVAAGASYGGLAAAWLGLRHPQVFGRVLSLSGSFWWSPDAAPGGGAPALDDRHEGEWLTRRFAEEALGDVDFVLSAGLFERSAPNDGPGILETTRHLRDVLRARGRSVRHREFSGGHDHLAWQRELLEGLALLLPASGPAPGALTRTS